MRIRTDVYCDPGLAEACSNLEYGEQEDYTVNVIASSPCTGTPYPGNTISLSNPVCPSSDLFYHSKMLCRVAELLINGSRQIIILHGQI